MNNTRKQPNPNLPVQEHETNTATIPDVTVQDILMNCDFGRPNPLDIPITDPSLQYGWVKNENLAIKTARHGWKPCKKEQIGREPSTGDLVCCARPKQVGEAHAKKRAETAKIRVNAIKKDGGIAQSMQAVGITNVPEAMRNVIGGIYNS